MAETLPYGRWPSPLTPASLFSGSESLSFLSPGADGLFFLLSRPDENGDQALMHLRRDGRVSRVSPPGLSVRSRVHEYGALPHAWHDGMVYYCRDADQCVLRQAFDPHSGQTGAPEPLTPDAGERRLRYGDFVVDARRRRLLCIREDHREAVSPRNALVAIDLEQGGEGEVLFEDSDFVVSPRLSPDGERLAFVTWNLPNMPWDDTELWLARIGDSGALEGLQSLPTPGPSALAEPLFAPDGTLCFLADWTDWWNLYRVSVEGFADAVDAEALCPLDADCCPPAWQFGVRHYAFLDAERLLLSFVREGIWELALLDRASGQLTPLHPDLGTLDSVFTVEGEAYYLAATLERANALWSLTAADGKAAPALRFEGRGAAPLEAESLALPVHLSYPSGQGSAHALFYAPRHATCEGPPRERPPLVVAVHGGPTSSARAAYNEGIQFWTTRGYAYLDVNHRGSTGYGRRFRQSLYGQWGVLDLEDIVNAVRHLIEEDRVDPARVVIRGGSAGGYAVLAALAASELFSAGCSYYGISDLALLAQDTHKFESRYLDLLIGPWPDCEALYRERSPIHSIEKIRAPVLLLQGLEDKVVPPAQAEALFERLRERSARSRLIRFPGEGHGFRQPANREQAQAAELAFYEAVLWEKE